MGNYEELKQAVSEVIKSNGNQEITGDILQNILLTIISTIGGNAAFTGLANPDTNPGTPDQYVFYIAYTEGDYVNFNNIHVDNKEAVIIYNKNNTWERKRIYQDMQHMTNFPFFNASLSFTGEVENSADTIVLEKIPKAYILDSYLKIKVIKSEYNLKYRLAFYNNSNSNIYIGSWTDAEYDAKLPDDCAFITIGLRAYKSDGSVMYSEEKSMPFWLSSYLLINTIDVTYQSYHSINDFFAGTVYEGTITFSQSSKHSPCIEIPDGISTLYFKPKEDVFTNRIVYYDANFAYLGQDNGLGTKFLYSSVVLENAKYFRIVVAYKDDRPNPEYEIPNDYIQTNIKVNYVTPNKVNAENVSVDIPKSIETTFVRIWIAEKSQVKFKVVCVEANAEKQVLYYNKETFGFVDFFVPPICGDVQNYFIKEIAGQIDKIEFIKEKRERKQLGFESWAHLGYDSISPSNTISSYKLAGICGFDGCVANPLLTSDGDIICYHVGSKTLTNDNGLTYISLSAEEVQGKTIAEMTSYNAGLIYSEAYKDDFVPTFDEYCYICSTYNMRPILSTHINNTTMMNKILSYFKKYNLLNKAVVRSYYLEILQTAYSILGNKCGYLLDNAVWNDSNISAFISADLGEAQKFVSFEPAGYSTLTNENRNTLIDNNIRFGSDPITNLSQLQDYIKDGVTINTTDYLIF